MIAANGMIGRQGGRAVVQIVNGLETIMVAAMLVLVVVLLASVALLWMGLRGKRVDGHPVCGKCGFDLVGLPVGIYRCSECGADLGEKGVVRQGRRERRKGMLSVGLGLVVVSVGWLVLLGSRHVREVGIQRYKPGWWLVSDTGSGDARVRAVALGELTRRMREGKLPAEQIAKVVDRVLAIQGDVKQPWVVAWGDFVEAAHAQGKLPREAWQRYAKQVMPVPVIRVRPKVRRGARLPVDTSILPMRAGAGTGLLLPSKDTCLWVESRLVRVAVDGKYDLDCAGPFTWGFSNMRLSWRELEAIRLDTGSHELRMMWQMRAYDSPRADGQKGSVPLAEVRVEVRGTFELVEGETVTVRRDAELKGAVEASIKVFDIIADEAEGSVHPRIYASPVVLQQVYEVSLRQGEQEWACGPTVFRAGREGGWALGCPARGLAGTKVDVILRPSVDAAEREVDVEEMWGEEVVIKDVLVKKAIKK